MTGIGAFDTDPDTRYDQVDNVSRNYRDDRHRRNDHDGRDEFGNYDFGISNWQRTPEQYAFVFLQWWDTLKEIEKRYNVDAVSIAKEIRTVAYYRRAQKRAKEFKTHRLIDYWSITPSPRIPPEDFEYVEFNDKRIHVWLKKCPYLQTFRNWGRTDEEIFEIAELFCNCGNDEWEPAGFNPNFECFNHPRNIMLGDDHCTMLIEDHGGPPASYHFDRLLKKYPQKYGL